MSDTIVDRRDDSSSGPPPASRPRPDGSQAVKASSLAGAWRRFAMRRGIALVVNIVLLVLVTFFIVQLIPGDPAAAIAGEDASQTEVDQIRVELGLDQPWPVQLGTYLVQVAQGDFGTSFQYKVPAMQIVGAAAPYTFAIAFTSLIIFLVVGLALGMAVGIITRGDRHRWLDHSFNIGAGIVSSIPAYVQATILVTVFAVWLAILPPAYSPAYNVVQSAILPIAALSIGCIASVARIVRREAAVILEQDYMRTARGWRLRPATLYAKHLLPNLLTTALTLSGIILTALLGSTLIVEAVFAWPGLGSVVVQAISEYKDYPVIRASVFVIGAISLMFNLAIDVVLGLIDPRTLGDDRG
ncbi:ABC transporter permease [Microbacterium sp. 18062]|uniref:ABC transporter permease n=1 Tax=Microbacterium sp. 18062 TaxID=2681410 RepID=UPI001F38C7DB|nr:ABC transporter permease [Microbacterium sp. 18062]